MKLACILIVSIFNLILWTSIKATPIRKGLARLAEKDYTTSKTLNDGAESSVNPQIQKYKETLKPKLKITKKDTYKGGNKLDNKRKYNKEYYQKNKKSLIEKGRNYQKQNKEKIKVYKQNYYKMNSQYMQNYREKNREKIKETKQLYYQNNKEKSKEYKRKYRLKKKRQSNNNEGTSFVNPQTGDFIGKGKLPIVCEEEGNHFNQGEEECNKGEDEQNQIEVEEPNKILEDDTINLNKKTLPFDLNEKPDDEECEDY